MLLWKQIKILEICKRCYYIYYKKIVTAQFDGDLKTSNKIKIHDDTMNCITHKNTSPVYKDHRHADHFCLQPQSFATPPAFMRQKWPPHPRSQSPTLKPTQPPNRRSPRQPFVPSSHGCPSPSVTVFPNADHGPNL